MNDSYLFEESAIIISITDYKDGRKAVILDQTIFYPQGGGQRFDTGVIYNPSASFNVEEVRYEEGHVLHIGHYTKGEFKAHESVMLTIHKELRILHSKLQSGGHLIDMAMRNIGYSHLTPAKGAHYPEWSEVQYEGVIPPEEISSIISKLQSNINEMTKKGYEVKTELANREQAKEKCYTLPPALPDNKPIRIVAVWDNVYMPCGGTHVKNISELQGLTITKLKCKKGITKVSYTINKFLRRFCTILNRKSINTYFTIMRYGRYGWSHLFLSWGIGIVFFWIGVDILRHPDAWIGYLPANLPLPFSREFALKLNGLFDVALGAMLFLRFWPKLSALLAIVHLVGILFTQGLDAVLIRDVGLLGLSLALFMWPTHYRRKGFSFFRKRKTSAEEMAE